MRAHTAEQTIATWLRFRDRRIAGLSLAFKAGPARKPGGRHPGRVAAALPDVKILAVEPHAPSLPRPLGDLGNVALTDKEHAIAESDVKAPLVTMAAPAP
jgi:hypothetical protein